MNVATQRGSGDDQMVLYSNEIDIVNVHASLCSAMLRISRFSKRLRRS